MMGKIPRSEAANMARIVEMPREELKPYVFMEIAATLSQLGTCDRSHVGAVLVRNGRCVSWGYNGAPPGAPHCSENGHGWAGHESEIDVSKSEAIENLGCRNATHAEANALAFAALQGISTDLTSLYVSLSPCETCARLLIAAGVWYVYYANEYRDPSGLEVLRQAKVEVHHLPL